MRDLHQAPKLAPVPKPPGHAIRALSYKGEPHFLFHYHPEFELVFTRGSVGRRIIGDVICEYARKDLVLLGPNLPHTWASEPQPADEAMPMDNFVLQFTIDSIGRDFLSREEMRPIARMLERAEQGLHFQGPESEFAQEWMTRIGALDGAKRMIAFFTILDCLASCRRSTPIVSQDYTQSISQRDHQLLAQAIGHIRQHAGRHIKLEEIAGKLRMSVPTFCRFFRRATGKSFVDYVNDWRISHACALLSETKLPVLSISSQVGFDNLSHFNRQFIRRRGKTPRQFRSSAAPAQRAKS